MAKYIDADALKNKLISSGAICDFGQYLIDIQPAADVRPERHGRWVDYKHNTSAIQCTVCEHIFESAIFGYAYCPICGAKMDGKDGESG